MDNSIEIMNQLMTYSEMIVAEYIDLIRLDKINNLSWEELHDLTRKLYHLVNKEKLIYQNLNLDEIKKLITLCENNYRPSEKRTMRVRIRLEERKRVLEKPQLTHNGYSYIVLVNSIVEKLTYSKMLERLNSLVPGNLEEAKLKDKLLDNLDFSMKAYHIKNNFSEDMMFFEGFGNFSPLSIDLEYTKMDEEFLKIMQFYFLNESKNLINLLGKSVFQQGDNYSVFLYDTLYKSTKLEILLAFCNDESIDSLIKFWNSKLFDSKKSPTLEINRNIKRLIKERKERLS